MAKYSKLNIVYLLQKWMDSVAGQTFMNYAYSWGASIVILGTLFKLTHLPGANLMLFLGMGTEVFVFFISAFDRPFDKTTEGMDLATDSQLEAELAKMQGLEVAQQQGPVVVGGTVIGGNVVGGEIPEGAVVSSSAVSGAPLTGESTGNIEVTGSSTPIIIGSNAPTPAPAVSAETAEEMEEVTKTYVERLSELNEVLVKVSALSEKLSIDSEEMENLNRTLTGIARVYEMQLKSASQQITTQDSINEQTRKMAEKIAELNSCYTRMIEAMQVNKV